MRNKKTEKEKQNGDLFLENTDFIDLLACTQLCLLQNPNPPRENLENFFYSKLPPKIKGQINRSADKDIFVKNILNVLDARKELFLKEYEMTVLDKLDPRFFSFKRSELIKHFMKSSLIKNYNDTYKSFVPNIEKHIISLIDEVLSHVKERRRRSNLTNFVFKFWFICSLICFVAVIYYISKLDEFNVKNSILAFFYLFSAFVITTVLNHILFVKIQKEAIFSVKKDLENSKEKEAIPDLSISLSKVIIFPDRNSTSRQVTYCPVIPNTAIFNSLAPVEISPSEQPAKQKATKRKNLSENSAEKENPNQKQQKTVPESLIDFNIDINGEKITSKHENVREMHASSLPRKAFFALFNERKLNELNNIDSVTLANYKNRWNIGIIVPPHGKSGIKKLKSLYFVDGKFFEWELKTVGTKSRCLGRNINTVYDKENKPHTLVAFEHHLDKGLH